MSQAERTPDDVTMFVIRHASAGRRDESDPADSERHLDARGHEQARRLAERLGNENIGSIVSSPLIRCTQTVEPLSVATDVPVEIDVRFAEMTPVEECWAALEAVVAAARENIGSPRRSAVICSHGDIIPDLMRLATLRGTRIVGKSGHAKGALWQLTGWNGVTFETARYLAQEDF